MQVGRAGDIVAIGGLKDVITGETLCDEKAPIILERMDFPDPVIKIAIEPKSKVRAIRAQFGFGSHWAWG